MAPTDAIVLDNWIVRPGQVTMRKGQATHTTGTGTVETLMPWSGPASGKLFGATAAGIFDMTAAGTFGSVVSAATNARWQFTNFSNSVASWLACCNGIDEYRFFDGTTWTNVATFPFGDSDTLTTNECIQVVAYQQRLFFVREDDLNLYFLGPGAIQGAIEKFPLAQLCRLGGKLIALGTWTVDAGNGPDDYLVMVTSEGEVIVYQGIDPGDASEWTLEGVYFIGRPIGRRCLQKYGGDLLFLCDRGFFPLSKVLQSTTIDRTAALTDKINPSFTLLSQTVGGLFGWEICQNLAESFLLINVPGNPVQQLVMDANSKSWSRFLSYEASCWAFFNGAIYYGAVGKVVQAYVGTSDFGSNIVATMQSSYNYFGNKDGLKNVEMLRPTFSSTGKFNYALNVSTDFDVFGGPSNVTFASSSQARWDDALWDQAVWAADLFVQSSWNGVAAYPFFAMSLGIQISSMTVTPSLVAVDYALTSGGIL